VRPSNEAHKQWARRRLEDRLGALAGKTIAVWGLTYKPGTDTLRRSASVELCRDLAAAGAAVVAWDPAIRALPDELAQVVALAADAGSALRGASALVIATEWPELAKLPLAGPVRTMQRRLVVDANRFLAKAFAEVSDLAGLEYYAVGVPTRG
jgi:UDPglucose 6-dehydrogenase